jgi:hypothetical protein
VEIQKANKERKVRTPVRYWLMALVLLVACQAPRTQEPAFPEISTPLLSTQTQPLLTEPAATELPLPTQPPGAEPPAAAPTAAPTQVAPAEPSLGIHISDFSTTEKAALFPRPGLLWTRFDKINWDLIEPERTDPPTYDWSQVDEASLANAAGSGFRVIGIILFSPEWAQKYPPSACGPIAEEALERFGQFMNALVSRYSQPPYQIKYWEVGNEPDIDRRIAEPHSGYGCWGDGDDPQFGGAYYAEMLKVVYPQVKAADPEAKLVVGGLLMDCDPVNPPESSPGVPRDCSQSNFLEGILDNGGGDFFDAVSYHSYDYYGFNEFGRYFNLNWHSSWSSTGPVLVAKTRFLRDVLQRYGYSDKELLNTELALICGTNGREPECQTDEYQTTKAYYVAQAAAAGLAEGLDANIWYSLEGWRGSALVNSRLKPFPAYQALIFSAEQLERAEFQREVTDFEGVKGYEFEREGARIWILWSMDGASHSITLPAAPSAAFDVFGAELPASQELEITRAPVYIEMNP